jgi:hypothetical protein
MAARFRPIKLSQNFGLASIRSVIASENGLPSEARDLNSARSWSGHVDVQFLAGLYPEGLDVTGETADWHRAMARDPKRIYGAGLRQFPSRLGVSVSIDYMTISRASINADDEL